MNDDDDYDIIISYILVIKYIKSKEREREKKILNRRHLDKYILKILIFPWFIYLNIYVVEKTKII